MSDWFEKLEYDENPFSTDPRKFTDKLVDMDAHVQELFYRLDAGSMLVIEGKEGFGKTSLLMKAIERYGGKRKVIYVDSRKLTKELDIRDLLESRDGFFSKMMHKKPKNMILLLDNVQELSRMNNDRIKFYFDQNYIKSAVFTCESYSRVKFSDSLRDRIGNRVISIKQMSSDSAIKMINERTGNPELFNDKLIKEIFKLSNNNPKSLLENCEKVVERAVEKGRTRVQQIDVEEALGDNQ